MVIVACKTCGCAYDDDSKECPLCKLVNNTIPEMFRDFEDKINEAGEHDPNY
jgi:hypothetical protein